MFITPSIWISVKFPRFHELENATYTELEKDSHHVNVVSMETIKFIHMKLLRAPPPPLFLFWLTAIRPV